MQWSGSGDVSLWAFRIRILLSSLKNDVYVPSKSNEQTIFLLALWRSLTIRAESVTGSVPTCHGSGTLCNKGRDRFMNYLGPRILDPSGTVADPDPHWFWSSEPEPGRHTKIEKMWRNIMIFGVLDVLFWGLITSPVALTSIMETKGYAAYFDQKN